jgi:hypothetical protein
MACTRCARTPNSRCVASLKPAVSRIVRLASRRPARDFGIGARPTVFQVHTMVRLAADVASWQTKMSYAAAMVSLAPHFRGHARQISGLEDNRSARWRISALVRAAVGSRLLCFAAELQPRHQPQEEADRISQPALFRCAGIYAGGASSSRRASRR